MRNLCLSHLILALSLSATPAVVNKCVNGNEAPTSTLTCSSWSNGANTAHNFLIVTTTAVRHATTPSISDSLGNTYVQALSYTDLTQTNPDGTLIIWYVADCKGGSNTITETPASGSAALEIHASEWSGMSGWIPDQTAADSGQAATNITSPTKTTTANGELIFAYTFPAGTSSPGTGFTGLSLVNGDWDEYQVQTSAGSIAATFTQTVNGYWLVGMVTFMSASPPPTSLSSASAAGWKR